MTDHHSQSLNHWTQFYCRIGEFHIDFINGANESLETMEFPSFVLKIRAMTTVHSPSVMQSIRKHLFFDGTSNIFIL